MVGSIAEFLHGNQGLAEKWWNSTGVSWQGEIVPGLLGRSEGSDWRWLRPCLGTVNARESPPLMHDCFGEFFGRDARVVNRVKSSRVKRGTAARARSLSPYCICA